MKIAHSAHGSKASLNTDFGGGLPATRIHAPAPLTSMLERTRLIDRLDSARNKRLIQLTAPAGFGKTTLLSQWASRRAATGDRVAWVSADDEDLSPGTLIDSLAQAAAVAGVDGVAPSLGWTHASGIDARQRLRRLVNTIAVDAEPLILIVDDIDTLQGSELQEMLSLLLRWAPNNLLIVLSGRGRVDIPVSSLMVQGLVSRIVANDLQFDLQDVVCLFGPPLTLGESKDLLERSRGWPAIIGLLRLVWAGNSPGGDNPQMTETLRDMTGDYLSEQVLGALSKAERETLEALSLLDIINDEAADAMVDGGQDCWHGLLRRRDFQPLAISDGSGGSNWRLHPLVRDALRNAFDARNGDERRPLHVRAARWLGRQGALVASVNQAILGGDYGLAAQFIFASGSTRIWIRQGRTQLEAIDALLNEAILDQEPRLKLLRALVQIKRGELSDAERLFHEATAALQSGSPEDDDTRFDRLLVESTLLFNQCKPSGDEYLVLYAQRMEQVGTAEDMVLGNVKTLMALSLEQRSVLDRALAMTDDAQVHYARADLPHGSFFVELHRASACFAKGLSVDADIALDRAHALAKRHFPDDDDKQLLVAISRAEIAADAGKFALADRRLNRVARRLPHMEAWHRIHSAAYGTMVAIALSHGDDRQAISIIDAAEESAHRRGLTGLLPFLAAQRMLALVHGGQADQAERVARSSGLTPGPYVSKVSDRMIWREREAVLTAFAQLALAQGRFAAVDALIDLPLREWEAVGLSRPRIQLHLAGAIAADALTLADKAQWHLESALTLAQISGHQRAFFDNGARLAAMLKSYCGRHRGLVEAILKAIAEASQGDALPALTSREQEVLDGLAKGLSAKQIARQFDLTENTVKFHIKNIYGKFRVNNRSEAIERARALPSLAE